jgi:two-component system, chemotaxis family, sensor kinase CheA
MNDDNEILQDFLVEAGEILEKLGEQLVDLESRPDDKDLLNAVFRGFHTIKGGASFLSLTPLVEVCHRAEDVFNILRQGQRQVDAQLMDVMLEVLDALNRMFASLLAGEDPEQADPAILEQLDTLSIVGQVQNTVKADVAPVNSEPPQVPSGDITDVEFDQLLGALGGQEPPAPAVASAANDEITDAEFEALLDQLHGPGAHSGTPAPAAAVVSVKAPPQSAVTPVAKAAKPAPDLITDSEFDALLDQLHGPAKKGGQEKEPSATEPPAKSEAKPASVRAAKPDAQEAVAPVAETTVRVDTKRIDDIMNMVGELVLVRNRLVTLETGFASEEMTKAVSNLDVVTANLQIAVMKTRMQPIKKVFGRFPRVVRDLARSLKKEVNLELQGEDTDLDKNLVEALADPLVHLVRNAVDHGIEMPDVRAAKGKPRAGTVILAAEQEGDHILLTIADDGAGMDSELLRRKVVEKGLMDADAAARLDQRECFNLIFMPGFSTKAEISDVSGRGVGMDVVKTRISQLNGVVEIDSTPGKGSRLIIKVPLTLAIIPTLMVVLGDQIFALPLVSVSEIFNLDLKRTNVIDGQLTVMVRDKPYPLFYLRHWLVPGAAYQAPPENGHVVIVHFGIQRLGFVVDQLIGQEEVVIKPLGALLHGTQGIAGATITGDGRIALILDVPGMMKTYARRAA